MKISIPTILLAVSLGCAPLPGHAAESVVGTADASSPASGATSLSS